MNRIARVMALAVVVSGCGYALAGKAVNLPDYIKVIGIPTFKNLTHTPELDRMFTEAIHAEFQKHRRFRIVSDAAGADAVLTGSITSLDFTATAFVANTRQGSQYSVRVVGTAEFKDVKANKSLCCQSSIRVEDEIDLSTSTTAGNDAAAFFTQDRNARERLALAFARKLVLAILEDF